MNKSLKNKIYIVSGGSTGIGYHITKSLLNNNSTVIICSRNEKKLKKSVKKLKKISKNIYYYKLDISKLNDVKKFKKWIIKKFNNIDGLINNAGVLGPIGKTTNLKIKNIKETININLFGTLNMINTFYPIFNKNNRRKIINLSGGGSTNTLKNYTSYSISKTSIVRLTENLSIELENTDINSISPGFIATNIHKKTLKLSPKIVGKKYYEITKDKIKNGGDDPNKTSELILFLLSKKSDNISGKLISAIWDPWENEDFQYLLKNDIDIATLRRIDKKYFDKI